MLKYNFALVSMDNPEQFIAYATELSYQIQEIDKYRLDKNTIPHVTLCQFDAEEDKIDYLWEQFQALNQPHSIPLTFENIRNNANAGLNWFSLIPKEVNDLHSMHNNTLTIIKDPKSIYGKNYDPHLTLLSSRDMEKDDSSRKIDNPLRATFVTAITNRDNVGQALQIVRCNVLKPCKEKEIYQSLLASKNPGLKPQ